MRPMQTERTANDDDAFTYAKCALRALRRVRHAALNQALEIGGRNREGYMGSTRSASSNEGLRLSSMKERAKEVEPMIDALQPDTAHMIAQSPQHGQSSGADSSVDA